MDTRVLFLVVAIAWGGGLTAPDFARAEQLRTGTFVMDLLIKNFPAVCAEDVKKIKTDCINALRADNTPDAEKICEPEVKRNQTDCQDTENQAIAAKQKLTSAYQTEAVKNALTIIYSGEGQGLSQDSAAQLNQTAKNGLSTLHKSVAECVNELEKRERVHTGDKTKIRKPQKAIALIQVTGWSLKQQQLQIEEGMKITLKNEKAATLSEKDLRSISGISGGLSEQDRSKVQKEFTKVETALDNVVKNPGKNTIDDFVDSVNNFCSSPGSNALRDHPQMRSDCDNIPGTGFSPPSYIAAFKTAAGVATRHGLIPSKGGSIGADFSPAFMEKLSAATAAVENLALSEGILPAQKTKLQTATNKSGADFHFSNTTPQATQTNQVSQNETAEIATPTTVNSPWRDAGFWSGMLRDVTGNQETSSTEKAQPLSGNPNVRTPAAIDKQQPKFLPAESDLFNAVKNKIQHAHQQGLVR